MQVVPDRPERRGDLVVPIWRLKVGLPVLGQLSSALLLHGKLNRVLDAFALNHLGACLPSTCRYFLLSVVEMVEIKYQIQDLLSLFLFRSAVDNFC